MAEDEHHRDHDEELSDSDRQAARKLGIPPTRAALTEARNRIGRLYVVVERLKKKYGIEVSDEK